MSSRDVCDRCGRPVILVNGSWQHAEPADTAACALFYATPLFKAGHE